MSEVFPIIPLTVAENARLRANALMDQFNQWSAADVARFRAAWMTLWDVNQSAQDLQALLDTLATNPMGTSNALAYYFSEAVYELQDLLHTVPTAFDDAKLEHTGMLQPDGVTPYKQFFGPGWYYTIDSTGRMIVSSPCIWAS